jgi:polyisoprenoid-binding protein YceI
VLACRTALVAIALWSALAAASVADAEPRRFVVKPEISEVSFKATSRFMNGDGRFHRFAGDIVVDPRDSATARIAITIEAASIDTGIGKRDSHLRSADFFDAERFPTITFESVRVEGTGRHVTVVGRLTVRGVTHEIAVPVEVALSDTAMVATGEFVLNRGDYGMNYNSTINPIGNAVRVSFTFSARPS